MGNLQLIHELIKGIRGIRQILYSFLCHTSHICATLPSCNICMQDCKGMLIVAKSQHGRSMDRTPLGPKTDRDRLIEYNLGCFCLKTSII